MSLVSSPPVENGSGKLHEEYRRQKYFCPFCFLLKQDRAVWTFASLFLLLLVGLVCWSQSNAIGFLQIRVLRKKRKPRLRQSSLKQSINQLQQRRHQRALQTAQVKHMEALRAVGTPGAPFSLTSVYSIFSV